VVKSGAARQRAVLAAGVLLVGGVVMVSTLFGMGPPPQDPAVYLATRGDQQLRYMALIACTWLPRSRMFTPFLLRDHGVPVEICGALLKLGKVLDALQRSL
jgi:hypothetical protein